MIPGASLEGPLGPYKLSWFQDNGTQVRRDKNLCSLGVPESPLRASEWLSLGGGPRDLGGLGLPPPSKPTAPTFPFRLRSLLNYVSC